MCRIVLPNANDRSFNTTIKTLFIFVLLNCNRNVHILSKQALFLSCYIAIEMYMYVSLYAKRFLRQVRKYLE